ncbi:MAG: hypothetical protein WBP79_08645, partial [Candidatus Acidiferrales bacterium]
MVNAKAVQQRRRYLIKCAAIVTVLTLSASACAAQATPAVPPQDLNKYRELVVELRPLVGRLYHDLQFPPARGESRL